MYKFPKNPVKVMVKGGSLKKGIDEKIGTYVRS